MSATTTTTASSTSRSVAISIMNTSGQQALVQLYHQNASGNDNQAGGWLIQAGQQVSAFNVQVDTLYGNSWFVKFTGWSNNGSVYTSNGYQSGLLSTETAVTFQVNTSQFVMPLSIGTVNVSMVQTGPSRHVTNVFVLMLENHSFDNIFGRSGISGISIAGQGVSNSWALQNYPVSSPAPYSLTTDPGHEFLDVVQQLTQQVPSRWTNGQAYPPFTRGGFVTNYATSATENTGLPDSSHFGDVMKCFDTATQLPVILKLAQEFAICDHWFSSMPGPTWPNRYFAHCASSANMDDSPSGFDAGFMQSLDGLSFDNGTIYDKLDDANLRYRLYNDSSNRFADVNPGTSTTYGSYAQVSSLEGIATSDVNDLNSFLHDLRLPYPYQYTFIEPNYGDVDDETFANGSSQHPEDGMGGGEGLIKFVYETIRNSPVWYTSLLIITYDEHGGFYDSITPPPAKPPGDTYFFNWYNSHGFKFDLYGLRVPAVVISPMIAEGTVDRSIYDHSSIPKTLENIFSLTSLTSRDRNAKSLSGLVKLGFDSVRTQCVTTLPNPVRAAAAAPLTSEEKAQVRARPLPAQGNVWGFLHIMAKTEYELLGKTDEARAAINERVKSIETFGDAQDYHVHVQALLKEWQATNAAQSGGTPVTAG